MRRIKIFVTLVLLAIAVFSGAVDNRNKMLAADYSCHNTSTCPGIAQCTGDRYANSGTCAITCYKEAGQPAGLIVANGSANCSPPTGGSGGGGGGGGGGTVGEGCGSDWDCFAGETCNQGTCEEIGGGGGGGIGGLGG